MSWIGDKAEATANVLKDLLTQTPAAKLYRQGLPNVLDALLNTREEEWRSKIQAMPKPFDSSPEAINRDMEAAMAFWNPAGMLGKIVYHGSPHKFDKFDASKIGTGEGAQAYGHGVYLADAPDVAQSYTKGGGAFQKSSPVPNVMIGDKWAQTMPRDSLESQAATVFANDLFGATIPEKVKKLRSAKMEPVADFLEKNADQFRLSNGEFYKADLPDEWIPKMLDWDKPLSQQPENVRLLAKDLGLAKDATGKDVYSALSNQARDMGIIKGRAAQTTLPGSQGRAAADLSEFGIPGIRYLDGGSRGAGQGSYNYVVFPGLEDKVKILERNGQPVNALAEILK